LCVPVVGVDRKKCRRPLAKVKLQCSCICPKKPSLTATQSNLSSCCNDCSGLASGLAPGLFGWLLAGSGWLGLPRLPRAPAGAGPLVALVRLENSRGNRNRDVMGWFRINPSDNHIGPKGLSDTEQPHKWDRHGLDVDRGVEHPGPVVPCRHRIPCNTKTIH
jgi:hypothetical protein